MGFYWYNFLRNFKGKGLKINMYGSSFKYGSLPFKFGMLEYLKVKCW